MTSSAWAKAREQVARWSAEPTIADAPVLLERAARLARPIEEEADDARLDVLELTIGGQRSWIAATWVRGVHEYRRVTKVPGVTPALLGVARFRGLILPVFDLGLVLTRVPHRISTHTRLVSVGREKPELVIIADAVIGASAVRTDGLVRASEVGLVEAFGPDGELLIGGEATLADPRFFVDHGDQG